jgi:GNAT superfamily N-acetyltransferase
VNEEPEPGATGRLTEEHNLRMNRIDPRVAPASWAAGDRISVSSTGNGSSAAGRIQEYRYDENEYDALWGALRRHILQVRIAGTDPGPAFGDVVAGLLARLDAGPGQGVDQSVAITWPSLDTACAAPLVHHGFAPLTSLVVKQLPRTSEPPTGTTSTTAPTVRPARPGDLNRLADQAEQLHRFEISLGALPERPALRARLRAELSEALADEDSFVLTALIDEAPVGFLHGQLAHGAWIERQITMEPAGYLSRLYVEPSARRQSVGRSLIAAAYTVLRAHGARAVLLHHTLHNPLAAPMWAELGYRPVLTTWTRRCPSTGERPTAVGARGSR